MPFQFDCPRCKQPLIIPSKRAGSYATCPSCKGRLWVPERPPADAGTGGPSEASGVRPAPVAIDPNGSGGRPAATRDGTAAGWAPPLAAASPLTGVRPAAASTPAAVPAPPVPPPVTAPLVPPGKTARLISAEAATSTIRPAADGKLPELQLEDTSRTLVGHAKGKVISPLVLLVVLSLSVVSSLVAVLVDFNAPDMARLRRKAEARRRIEANYFPLVAEHGLVKTPERYQRYLAEASRAHARGDRPTERRMYNRVLDLLRAERDRFQRGVTGSSERDKELEALITVLLSDD